MQDPGGFFTFRLQGKGRNGGLEDGCVIGNAEVPPVHAADRAFDARAAGVLKGFTGLQVGLLSYYAQALDLLVIATRVVNHPMAAHELCRDVSCIGHSDGVSETPQLVIRCGFVGQVGDLDIDSKTGAGHGSWIR